MAKQLLATAPAEFKLEARNPLKSVRFGGNATVFSPVGGPPFVSCLDRGRRYGTLEDLHNFIKLAHVAPAIHFSGGAMVEPMDIAAGKRHLDTQYAFFRYSDQGCEATPETPGHARDAIAMAELLFGTEFLETNTVVLGNINSNSPLTFDGRMLGSLRAFAEKGQGCIIVPAVLAGAMGPVTPAGCMAEILAETLAGMALTRRRSQTRRRPVFQVDMMKNMVPAIRSGNHPPWGIFKRFAAANGASTKSMPPATRVAWRRDQPKTR
jgi:trimethylamine--corrinoid protein Co-methyltransferase